MAKNSPSNARAWQSAPFVNVGDAKKANIISLDHLVDGADAIFFNVGSRLEISYDVLLHDIEWQFCSLFFCVQPEESEKIRKYITDSRLPLDQLTGGFFWETIPKKNTINFFLNELKDFNALGLLIAPDSPAREISHALLQGVRLVEECSHSLHDRIAAVNNIAFSLPAAASFADTIVKLKALRGLWFQVAQAFGASDYHPEDLHIHVRTEPWADDAYEPHGNMIFTTLAAMASVIGGCNALTLKAVEEYNTVMNRVARNVSSILREEAHLNKVSDPTSGSYAFEVMTNQIAKTAWKLFQSEIRR